MRPRTRGGRPAIRTADRRRPAGACSRRACRRSPGRPRTPTAIDLTYSLQYRREGEPTWHDLRAGLSDPIFVWDTTSVADGRYIVRVLASDGPSNAADRALVGDRESDPIEIDNTPPAVTTEIAAPGRRRLRLGVRVRDARSADSEGRVLDRRRRRGSSIYPVDGLADSPDERYEIPLAERG